MRHARAGRPRASTAMLMLAALLAVSPLLFRGVSCGHDLTFHLLNWMEVARQWHGGVLRPWWSFASAWNAGEPRFVFYPPASWVLGAAIGSIVGWTWAPVAYTWLVLLLCGIAMRRLLRRYLTEPMAMLGGCMYLANPYLLFTADERTAYAELLAAALMPLLLLEAIRERVNVARLAMVVGLLWLTNTPAAVLASYGLLSILLTRCALCAERHDWRGTVSLVARFACAFALGIGTSAFYLLPAVAQHGSVQVDMAMIPGMQVTANFLFQRSGDSAHDAVLRQASWLAVALLVLAAGALTTAMRHSKTHRAFHSMKEAQHGQQSWSALPVAGEHRRTLLGVLAVLSVCVLFLLTPPSAWMWRHAPELRFLQFPWRFLALQAAVSIAALLLAVPWRLKPVAAAGTGAVLAAALAWGAHAAFAQACDPEDRPTALRQQFLQGGFEPTDEYTPADADNDALRANLPQAWIATEPQGAPARDAPGVAATNAGAPEHLRFVVRAGSVKQLLIVRLRRFRNWQVRVDGLPQEAPATRDDGLIVVALPGTGMHNVAIDYVESRDQRWGPWIALVCMLVVALLYVFELRHARSNQAASTPIP